MVVPENRDFAVGSYAGDFSFTDDAGNPIPGFRTGTAARICLPFTQEDLDKAAGGVDGVHVVHLTPSGEFVRCPSDSDLNSMMTCAEVDHFSVYFVGLAVAAPTLTGGCAEFIAASPALVPTVALPFSTPAATQIPEPDPAPTPSPTS